MKIVIIGACSQRKSIAHQNQPKCDQLTSKAALEQYSMSFPEKRPAREMFRESYNISLNAAVRKLRKFFDVKYYILTAGFGLVHEDTALPPYDCSFSAMTTEKIAERGINLEVQNDLEKILAEEKPDLLYLALGQKHMIALGNWEGSLNCKTIAYAPSQSEKVISLPSEHVGSSDQTASTGFPFTGAATVKENMLLLVNHYISNQDEPEAAFKKLLDNSEELKYLIETFRASR